MNVESYILQSLCLQSSPGFWVPFYTFQGGTNSHIWVQKKPRLWAGLKCYYDKVYLIFYLSENIIKARIDESSCLIKSRALPFFWAFLISSLNSLVL